MKFIKNFSKIIASFVLILRIMALSTLTRLNYIKKCESVIDINGDDNESSNRIDKRIAKCVK